MGDETQQQRVHARPTAQASFPQHRQAAQKRGRAVAGDRLELFVDDMKIVENPFCGGGHDAALACRLRDRLIAVQQHAAVFLRPRGHVHAEQPGRLDPVLVG